MNYPRVGNLTVGTRRIVSCLFASARYPAAARTHRIFDGAGVAQSVIMKITGHCTRGIFERYNITDQSGTLEAGKIAEEFLNEAHSQNSSQISSQNRKRPN